MTTPGPTLEERVTILETRLDTILPTLATKEDIARLEGKIDAMGYRLLIGFTGVMAALLAIAVAATRFI
jgi:tetrahydromethanopterin S-methyltransferase subunit B